MKLCSVEKSINSDPLIQLTKSLVKHRLSLHNLLRYLRSSRYVYSRDIPMAEKRIACFQSKQSENMNFF